MKTPVCLIPLSDYGVNDEEFVDDICVCDQDNGVGLEPIPCSVCEVELMR